MTFYPSRFWHTEDWESSADSPREGYLQDTVLYAGDFEEVGIHLFPRVRTVRVRASEARYELLCNLGLDCSRGKLAYIFVPVARRDEVEAFRPTIFNFNPDGFTRVRRGEYVSWSPQVAIASETISIAEALARWNIKACYVASLDDVIVLLSGAGIYYEEQR